MDEDNSPLLSSASIEHEELRKVSDWDVLFRVNSEEFAGVAGPTPRPPSHSDITAHDPRWVMIT